MCIRDRLSGGQQQRTALARILASEPEALLLDEPFSALDSYLKWQVELELAELLDTFPGPVLFVTHDRDEVHRLCGRVCVLDSGRAQEVRSVEELFSAPRTPVSYTHLDVYKRQLWDCLARFAVPVFFMCTGALMLPPERRLTGRDIFRRYFLRVLVILLVWAWLYYVYEMCIRDRPDGIRTHDLQSRSLTLYPAELRARLPMHYSKSAPQSK